MSELHAASIKGDILRVKELLSNFGTKHDLRVKYVNGIDTDDDATALHRAAEYGRLDIVMILLANGAEVDSEDFYQNTPLFNAASQGFLDIVVLLLADGANVNITNYNGNTPLHIASNNGFLDVVIALLSNGADKTITNEQGKTPLDLADTDEIKEYIATH